MSDETVSEFVARVAFGVVLILGAGALALHVLATRHISDVRTASLHAWHIVVGAWLAGPVVALVLRHAMPRCRRPRNLDALRAAALWVPAVGVSLLLPLTLHLIVMASNVRHFEEWAQLTVYFVGHTHLAVAVMVYMRARALARGERPLRIRTIYLLGCVTALVPFVAPVLFVALTGIAFLPLLAWMEWIAENDRERSRDIPYAIARAA